MKKVNEKDGDFELGILFEDVISMNNIYGRLFDVYMPRSTISNLQELEDYIGECYNNFIANAEVKKDD